MLAGRAGFGGVEEPVEERAVRIAVEGKVVALDGTERSIRADTICVHGDTRNALGIARRVRESLEGAGVRVEPL